MAAELFRSPARCPPDGSWVGREGAWGRGKSRFANSPADGVGGARAPRCPPPARTWLLLAPGTWLPEWFGFPVLRSRSCWRGRLLRKWLGPGFWASPILAPSCQSCDRRSWSVEESASVRIRRVSCHRWMASRRCGPHEAQTCCWRSWSHDSNIACPWEDRRGSRITVFHSSYFDLHSGGQSLRYVYFRFLAAVCEAVSSSSLTSTIPVSRAGGASRRRRLACSMASGGRSQMRNGFAAWVGGNVLCSSRPAGAGPASWLMICTFCTDGGP